MKPKSSTPTTNGTQYIGAMALELAKMACDEGSDDLATILYMAALEAEKGREDMSAKQL